MRICQIYDIYHSILRLIILSTVGARPFDVRIIFVWTAIVKQSKDFLLTNIAGKKFGRGRKR